MNLLNHLVSFASMLVLLVSGASEAQSENSTIEASNRAMKTAIEQMKNGKFQEASGNFSEAIRLLEFQAMSQKLERNLGFLHQQRGEAYLQLGNASAAVGDFAIAISKLRQTDRQNPIVLYAYFGLAQSRIRTGDITQTLSDIFHGLDTIVSVNQRTSKPAELLLQMAGCLVRWSLDPTSCAAINKVPVTIKNRPSPNQLVRFAEKGLEYTERIRTRDNPETLSALLFLVDLYISIDRPPEEVKNRLEPYLEFFDRRPNDDGLRMNAHSRYGLALHEMGRDEEAISHMHIACGKCISGDENLDASNVTALIDLAGMFLSLRREGYAVDLLETAYTREWEFPQNIRAYLCAKLGETYLTLRRAKDALRTLSACKPMIEELYSKSQRPKEISMRASYYAALAKATTASKSLSDGLGILNSFIEEMKSTYGKDSKYVAEVIQAAMFMRAQNDDKEAAKIVAGEVCGDIPGTYTRLSIRDIQRVGNCAWLLADLGENKRADVAYAMFISGAEKLRHNANLSSQERLSIFSEFVGNYRRRAEMLIATDRHDEALYVSELAKSRNLNSALRSADAVRALSPSVPKIKQLGDLDSDLMVLDSDIARAHDSALRKLGFETRKVKLNLERNRLFDDLRVENPAFKLRTDVEIPAIGEIARKIGDDSLYFSLFLLRDRLSGIVVTNKGVVAARTKKVSPQLARTIASFRLGLSVAKLSNLADANIEGVYRHIVKHDGDCSFDVVDEAALDNPGTVRQRDLGEMQQCLSMIILDGFGDILRSKTHWIVSTDSLLSRIPFESLLIDGQWVVDKHSVSYSPSLSTLFALQERQADRQNAGRFLAVGNVPYPLQCAGSRASVPNIALEGSNRKFISPAFSGLHRLCSSKDEIDRVRGIFKDQAEVLEGSSATAAKLRSLGKDGGLDQFRYILISAHGFEHRNEPNLGAFILAPGTGGKADDANLPAADLRRLSLKSELVFLSACETGLGQIVGGEGVIGLPFALLEAGSTSAIVSLWEVQDTSAAEFVSRVFKKIHAGLSRHFALSETKREFRAGMAGESFKAPMHWVPYVLIGG
jgi:CHAT domain-containing protein/tetratricopeptide (TPR) repeat protein